MKVLRFPNATSSSSQQINGGNSNLMIADLGSVNKFAANLFYNNSSLSTIILRKSNAIVGLDNVSAFSGTPFKNGGAGGTIYIPKVLYDHLGDNTSNDYKKATNWATVDGYGTITWAKLEGSPYEQKNWDDSSFLT